MNELANTCGVHITDPNLPSEQKTVYNLIELISTTSPEILATLSMIRFNPSLRNIFDKTVAWLITADPKKKSSKKQTTANIGAVEVNNRIGETGVHFGSHTGNEYDRLSGAQIAELHNWRHSSAGKRSTTEDPEGGGLGRYDGRGGQGGRGWGRGDHGISKGQGRGNFENQVVVIIAKTAKNEANKRMNALEAVAASASAVNGSFPGILQTVPPDAPNPVVSAADTRKQQSTEYLNQIVGRG